MPCSAVDGERSGLCCLICNKDYIPYFVDLSLLEEYFATFETCMNLKVGQLEKVHFNKEHFPFCKPCLLLVDELHQFQAGIDNLRFQILKHTWNLTAIMLESCNKILYDGKISPSSFCSNTSKLREQVCNRYQVHVKLRHVKKLNYSSTDEFCVENVETTADFVADDRNNGDDSFYEGLEERNRKSLVLEVENNKFLYDNKFSFLRSGEDFECESCQYKSKSKYVIVQHIRLTHSEPTKGMMCETCGKQFKNSKTLSIHAKTHVLSSEKFNCKICSKDFKYASSMYFHQKSHHKDLIKKYPCNECNKSFFKKAALDLHAVTHSKDKIFECLHCNVKFARRNAWRVHTQINQNKSASLFSCTLCNVLFSHRCALSSHTLKVHNIKLNSSLKTEKSNQLENTSVNLEEGWSENFHKEPSRSSSSFSGQNTNSTNNKRTASYARICSKNNKVQQAEPDTFVYGDKFKFKSRDNEYHCLTCGHKSTNKISMVSHIRVVHLYTDRFVCECCGKAFRQPSDLRKHQKIHVTDCMYICELCGSKFKTLDGLRSHKRIHFGKTEKGFECEVCKKKYKYKKTLEEHTSQHKSQAGKIFECPECNKRFCHKRSRNFHLSCHRKNREKQFSCQLCEARFTQIYSLKRHSRMFHETENQETELL